MSGERELKLVGRKQLIQHVLHVLKARACKNVAGVTRVGLGLMHYSIPIGVAGLGWKLDRVVCGESPYYYLDLT